MTDKLLISGLSAIADRYDAVICDVWGVLHNGVVGYGAAGDALARFRASGKPVVLLTNAPRPAAEIVRMLARFGIPADAYDRIVTSGDVARALLLREAGKPVFHLGPDRDRPLFDGLGLELAPAEGAELVVATGLFDDDTETPENYRALFSDLTSRKVPMICANPDIVVERGDRLVYCAGALAQLYEALGGKVVWVGKPYRPVYDAAQAAVDDVAGRKVDKARLIAIGDAFPTDVRGAVLAGIDVLMVTAGIHAAEFGDPDAPSPELLATRLAEEDLKVTAAIPRLAW